MIRSKADLHYYMREDARRNGITNFANYLFHLYVGSEHARVYKYLRCLRKCEYHYNKITPPRQSGKLRVI